MKLTKKIEIAKVGNWNGIELTEDILQEMKDNFQQVPIRPGHTPIEPGQQANGYIKDVDYQNGVLSGNIELSEDLAEGYQNKKYLSWSLDAKKYHNGWNLTALALLGAEKPGIKGLRELQFSEEKTELTIIFQEEQEMLTPEDIKSIADAVVMAIAEERKKAQEEIDKKYEEIQSLREDSGVVFSEKEKDLQAKLDEANSKILEFAEKEKAAAQKAIDEHNAKVEARKKEILEFSETETEAEEFAMTFKDKPELAQLMDRWAIKDTRKQSKAKEALNFSEDEDKPKEKKKTLTEERNEAAYKNDKNKR